MNDSLISCANAVSRRICDGEREGDGLAICKVVSNGRHRFISVKLGGNEICYLGERDGFL